MNSEQDRYDLVVLVADKNMENSIKGILERPESIRIKLVDKGFLTGNSVKPAHPKEAVESALRIVNKPRSSSIFHRLAQSVSLKHCQDPAFLKLKAKLFQWFGL